MRRVYVRVRPLTSQSSAVEVTSSTSLTIEDDLIYSSPILTEFRCDGVIGPDQSVKDRIAPLVRAGDVVVLGYGHSGSGKTYSIFGPNGALDSVTSNSSFFDNFMDVSFLEVYNERVYDLLVEQPEPLSVFENRLGRVAVKNQTWIRVQAPDELEALVDVGLSHRIQAENEVHANSSRSHALLQLRTDTGRSVWFADLAGSERVQPLQRTTKEFREINSIHKSLHALRRCIMSLRKKGHVPARSSVLTRLLFSSEIAECVLIACVAPDKQCVAETLSTLDFASSGLNVTAWALGAGHKPVSEAEALRSALARVTHELETEKAKRRQLEDEISRNSTPALYDGTRRFNDLFVSKFTEPQDSDYSEPPTLVHSKLHEESIKCSPIAADSFGDANRKFDVTADESVLSHTWRHNQYDAILRKCWQS